MAGVPRIGDEFAGYRIEALIGRGGMSVVYRAQNLRLGSDVALKILAPELSEDDSFRERFVRESRIAATLNHPNVITIYDAGGADGLLYLAMRYVEGGDLLAVLRREGPLVLSRTLSIIGQVGSALDAAHAHDLIHRDIKPANILIDPDIGPDSTDHVYLTDFGLTKHSSSRSGLTATGQFVGTIDYCPPEQIQGKPLDGRADVYSLGCVLYQCLTGVVPFRRDAETAVLWAHVEEEAEPVSRLRLDLSPGLDSVVSKSMAKSRDERYSTCRAFVADLRKEIRALTGEGATPPAGITSGSVPAVSTQLPPEPNQIVQVPPSGAAPAPSKGPPTIVSPEAGEAPLLLPESETLGPAAVAVSAGVSVPESATVRPSRELAPPGSIGMEGRASVDSGGLLTGDDQPPAPAQSATPPIASTPPIPPARAGSQRGGRRIRVPVVVGVVVFVIAAMIGEGLFLTRDHARGGTTTGSGGEPAMGGMAGNPNFSVLQNVVLEHIPPAIGPHCKPASASAAMAASTYATLACHPGGVVLQVDYSTLHDGNAMRNQFALQADTHDLREDRGSCAGSVPSGALRWYADAGPPPAGMVTHVIGHKPNTTSGRVMCYEQGGRAWVEWYDGDTHIYAHASSAFENYSALYMWWLNSAGPNHPSQGEMSAETGGSSSPGMNTTNS